MQKLFSHFTGKTFTNYYIFKCVRAPNTVQRTVCYHFLVSFLIKACCSHHPLPSISPEIEEWERRQKSSSSVPPLLCACCCNKKLNFSGSCLSGEKDTTCLSSRCLQIYVFILAAMLAALLILVQPGYCAFILFIFPLLVYLKKKKKKRVC